MMMGYVCRSFLLLLIDLQKIKSTSSSSKIQINNSQEDREGGRERESRKEGNWGKFFNEEENINRTTVFPFFSPSKKKGKASCQILVLLSTFVSICTYFAWDSHRVDGTCVSIFLEANVFKAGEFVGT